MEVLMQESEKAKYYLDALCDAKPNRRTGSPGNREATDFFSATVNKWSFEVHTTPFPCLDYESGNSLANLIRIHKHYDKYFFKMFRVKRLVTAELL
jgi:hypothetical protein